MIEIVFIWYGRTSLLHINLNVTVIIQQNIWTDDISVKYVLRLEEFDITQHLYPSTRTFESNELKSSLSVYCCHVSLLRVNRCRDHLDQGKWHMLKNDIEVGFEFVSLDAFDETLSLDLKEPRGIFIPAWAWELSDRDYFWSWSIFCCSHVRSRAFLLRYRDLATDYEVIAFVVRASRGYVFHAQRRILPSFRRFCSRKVLVLRLGADATSAPSMLKFLVFLLNLPLESSLPVGTSAGARWWEGCRSSGGEGFGLRVSCSTPGLVESTGF